MKLTLSLLLVAALTLWPAQGPKSGPVRPPHVTSPPPSVNVWREVPRASRRAHRTAIKAVDVTAYCWTGNRTASGKWPRRGMAASNKHPIGTRLRVPGIGVVTVEDRIGHGTELDLYMGRAGCHDRATDFGRRHLRVEVLPK